MSDDMIPQPVKNPRIFSGAGPEGLAKQHAEADAECEKFLSAQRESLCSGGAQELSGGTVYNPSEPDEDDKGSGKF